MSGILYSECIPPTSNYRPDCFIFNGFSTVSLHLLQWRYSQITPKWNQNQTLYLRKIQECLDISSYVFHEHRNTGIDISDQTIGPANPVSCLQQRLIPNARGKPKTFTKQCNIISCWAVPDPQLDISTCSDAWGLKALLILFFCSSECHCRSSYRARSWDLYSLHIQALETWEICLNKKYEL